MSEQKRSIQDIADRTAELLVVGAVICDDEGDCYGVWKEHCCPDDITDPRLAEFMRHYLAAVEARGNACHRDVLDGLTNDGERGNALVKFFWEVSRETGIATPMYITTYAKRIADLGKQRRAIREFETLQLRIVNAKTQTERLLLMEQARNLPIPDLDGVKPPTKNEDLARLYQQIMDGRGRGPALRSPMATLTDMLCGGWRPGRIYVWAGPPGFGKTAFAIGEMLEACRQGKRALFMSLEMPRDEVNMRIISYISGVPMLDMGKPMVDQAIAIQRATSDASELDYEIRDLPGRKVSNIVEQLSKDHAERPLGFVVIDYLQRIVPTDPKAPQHQEIGRNSKALANLARLLKVPILLLSQCNRTYGNRAGRRFQMSDLAGSGEIEADADLVGFIWRPGKGQPGFAPDYAEIDIKKFREGPQDYRQVRFDGATYRFMDADSDIPVGDNGEERKGY